MTVRFNLLITLAVLLVSECAGVFGQSGKTQRVDTLVESLGNGFISGKAKVNGTTLHYVRGGTGRAVILLHGFPQDWYEFHQVMPRLAKKFTVVAVDLRGMGGSAATPGGWQFTSATFLAALTSAILMWPTTQNLTQLRTSCALFLSFTAPFRRTQSSTPPTIARPMCRFFWLPEKSRRSTLHSSHRRGSTGAGVRKHQN